MPKDNAPDLIPTLDTLASLVDSGGDIIGEFADLITEWDNPQYPFLVLKDKDDALRYAFEGSIKAKGLRLILDVLVRDLLAD